MISCLKFYAIESTPFEYFSPKSPGREGKKDRGRTWVVLAQIKIIFKYPKFSKTIFLKVKQFVEENKECFEMIFLNVFFVLKWVNPQN